MPCSAGYITLVPLNGVMSGSNPLGAPLTNVFDFTGADGDPAPSALTALAGDFQILGNRLFATGPAPTGTNGYIIAADTGVTEGTISATFNAGGGNGDESGLAFRIQDEFNFFDTVLLSGPARLSTVRVRNGGADLQELGSYTIPNFDDNQDYFVEMRIVNNDFTLFVDGVEQYTVTDSAFSNATQWGIKYGGTNTGIDNLNLPGAA